MTGIPAIKKVDRNAKLEMGNEDHEDLQEGTSPSNENEYLWKWKVGSLTDKRGLLSCLYDTTAQDRYQTDFLFMSPREMGLVIGRNLT